MKPEFPLQIFEKSQISNFLKTRPVGAKFHVDGQNITNLIVTFRNFANAPDNCLSVGISCKCSVLCRVYTLFPLGQQTLLLRVSSIS